MATPGRFCGENFSASRAPARARTRRSCPRIRRNFSCISGAARRAGRQNQPLGILPQPAVLVGDVRLAAGEIWCGDLSSCRSPRAPRERPGRMGSSFRPLGWPKSAGACVRVAPRTLVPGLEIVARAPCAACAELGGRRARRARSRSRAPRIGHHRVLVGQEHPFAHGVVLALDAPPFRTRPTPRSAWPQAAPPRRRRRTPRRTCTFPGRARRSRGSMRTPAPSAIRSILAHHLEELDSPSATTTSTLTQIGSLSSDGGLCSSLSGALPRRGTSDAQTEEARDACGP